MRAPPTLTHDHPRRIIFFFFGQAAGSDEGKRGPRDRLFLEWHTMQHGLWTNARIVGESYISLQNTLILGILLTPTCISGSASWSWVANDQTKPNQTPPPFLLSLSLLPLPLFFFPYYLLAPTVCTHHPSPILSPSPFRCKFRHTPDSALLPALMQIHHTAIPSTVSIYATSPRTTHSSYAPAWLLVCSAEMR